MKPAFRIFLIIFSLLFSANALAKQVAYYNFDGHLKDKTGINPDAIDLAPVFVVDAKGLPGRALMLSSVGKGVEIRLHSSVSELQDFTIVLVMAFREANQNDQFVLSKGINFGNLSLRKLGGNHKFWPNHGSYAHQTKKGNWSSLASKGYLPPVQQYFCWAVSVTPRLFAAYIDGNLVRQVKDPARMLVNLDSLMLGAMAGVNNGFIGSIDELVLLSPAIDAKTINKSYCSKFLH